MKTLFAFRVFVMVSLGCVAPRRAGWNWWSSALGDTVPRCLRQSFPSKRQPFSPHSFSILLLIYLDVVRIACFFLREDTSAAGTSCTWRARARREAWWSRSFLVQSEYRRRFIHSWSVANAYPRIEVLRSGSVTQLQFMHINS